jgi:hypothetical protein
MSEAEQDEDKAAEGGYIASVGVFGWGSVERVIMSALVADKPLLLLGGHGLTKTEFAASVAHALIDDVSYTTYDTPLLSNDDLLGILNPAKLRKGELEFIRTPASVWGLDAVCLDEVTRASPFVVGKLMELVRSKTVNGRATNIRLVFATANPPKTSRGVGYNANYLDLAMASRFAVVQVPSLRNFVDKQAKVLDEIVGMALDGRRESIDRVRSGAGFGGSFKTAVNHAKAAFATWQNKRASKKIVSVTKELARKFSDGWSPRQMQDFAAMVKAAVCLEHVTNVPNTLDDYRAIFTACAPQYTGIVAEQPVVDLPAIDTILSHLQFENIHANTKLYDLLEVESLRSDPLTLIEVMRDQASSVVEPIEVFRAASRLMRYVKDGRIVLSPAALDQSVMGLVSYGMSLDDWWVFLGDQKLDDKITAKTESDDVVATFFQWLLDADVVDAKAKKKTGE